MEGGEPAGKSVHHLAGGRSARDQVHEHAVGRKPPHPDHVIDGLAARAQPQRAVGFARDRHDTEVDERESRRFSRTSSSQKWWRSSGVLKSRKEKRTAFLSL